MALKTKQEPDAINPVTKLLCDVLSVYESFRDMPNEMQTFRDLLDCLKVSQESYCSDTSEIFELYTVYDHMWNLKRNDK